MKKSWLFLTVITALSAGAGEFEPGGVTYDFDRYSQQRFQVKTADNDNLFGKWKAGGVWIHHPDSNITALRPKVLPLVKFSQKNTGEGVILKTVKSNQIEAVTGQATVSGSWTQTVSLPDKAGGSCRFSMDYRSVKTGKYPVNGYVIISYRGDKSFPLTVKSFPAGSGKWEKYAVDLEIPAGASSMTVNLRLDGCGEIEFKAPSLVRKKTDYPASVILAPGALLDNNFALTRNDPAILTFAWKREVPKEQWAVKNPMLHVTLPEKVDLLESIYPLELISAKNSEYVFSMSAVRDRFKRIDGYDAYLLLPLMLTTQAAPGTKFAAASYWLTDGGKPISAKHEFTFSVLPQIPQAGKANHFLNGFQPMGLYLNIKSPANREMWTKFIGRTGSRWLAAQCDASMAELYRKNGILMITPELYWVANGYRIGDSKDKPEYAKYKTIGSSSSFDVKNGTCPAAIYKKTEFFTQKIIPYLKENLKNADGFISNWEPYMFHGMGCFCTVCRDEFASYARLTQEEVKKAWPHELLINRQYHAIGVKFRSWQHARLVKTIQEAVNEITGGKAGFIPEVAWIHMADCDARYEATGEHDPLDYAADLKYIDPWGPYTGSQTLTPYRYTKAQNLDTYIAAQRIVDFTRKNFPADKRPKLLALPHGMQGYFWVTQPEAIAMEVIGFCIAGFDASTVYIFPKGYDNRFWAVYAEANSLIAQNEELIFAGEKIKSVSATPLSPFPAPKKRVNEKYYNDKITESVLQCAAFRKGDTILAAVGNFWEKGECFFSLSVQDLKDSDRYQVTEKAAKRSFGTFSGKELKNGIILHAGALRWAFFEIEPQKKAPAMAKTVSQTTVKKELKERTAFLQKAANDEAARDALIDRDFQKSELKSMTSGPLSCTPATDSFGSQAIGFVSGSNALRLSMDSMAIQSWKVNKKEWISGSKGAGLGVPAFWSPPVQIKSTFLITGQTADNNGISITAEKEISRKISPKLERLKVRQTVTVSRDLKTVTCRTELINMHDSESGNQTVTAGFRYHIVPVCLGNGGSIDMTSGGKPYSFRRQNERMLFAGGNTESAAAVKKLFEVPRSTVMIDGNTAIWRMPESRETLRMTLAPAQDFAGIACWDTPNLKVPSFEPFFHRSAIKSGESKTYSLKLQVQ